MSANPSGWPSFETRHLDLPGPFALESGETLPHVRVAYRTWGSLDRNGANAVLICHALTGSADADRWWGGLIGAGRSLDPARDFVICSNVLGSCYGTTGPASPRPDGGGLWGPAFPAVTVRDMVRVQAALLDALHVRRLRLVLGGSLGGMQVLEWALLYPERVDAIAPIATSGRHSAWCIALSEAQRQAIQADPLWNGGRYGPDTAPASGLAAARAVAMCTYRSRESLEARFGRRLRGPGLFEVTSWLHHHGEQLVSRFDANTYITLTRAMDSHDVARGRGSYEDVLRSIDIPALVVTIDSDVLYPPEEQVELAALLPAARLATLRSPHGHDAFLIDVEALDGLLAEFRASVAPIQSKTLSTLPEAPVVNDFLGSIPGSIPGFIPAVRRPVGVILVGPRGRVARALRARLSSLDTPGIELHLVGAVDRHTMLWDPEGLDPLEIEETLLAAGEPTDWHRLLKLSAGFRHPLILIDGTASPEVADRYADLLARGIGVVTPNKLAGAGRLETWRLLRDLAFGGGVPYRYETTVGAALPVLGPVADLRRTGDRLLSVSAVLSGTLAFVLSRVEAGLPFSEAVREAWVRGYTEPHPKEDLSGEDVARKLLILLREAGYEIERNQVEVEPLLTGGLPIESSPEAQSPEAFLDALTPWDEGWSERAAQARNQGHRLLYLASFDGTRARVGVAALPADHPVARGGPGENVIVYRTERYSDLPLTVAGPGAGPEVTATGVLADLIAAAREIVSSRPEERAILALTGTRPQLMEVGAR